MDGGCARCGSFTGLTPYRSGHLCREHWHRAPRPSVAAYAVLAVGVVWALAAAAEAPRSALLLALPAEAVLVTLHEGGHALVAWIAGMRVGRLTLGTGPTVLSRRVGHGAVDVRLLPIGGSVVIAPRGDPRRVRWRLGHLAVLAAGPAVNIALVVLAFPRIDQPFWTALCGVAVTATLIDVIDAASSGPARALETDLFQLIHAWRHPVPVAFDQPGLWWVTTDDYYDDVQAVMAGRGQLSRVADAVLRLRALQPDEAHWQYMEAWLLVEARQWAAARDRFAALRDVSPPLAADGIASVDALSGERPEEMAEEAATALRLAPDDPNVVATNALVAARQGRFADAEAFCARAEAGVGDSPVLLAVVSAIRAYSASLRGDEAAARAHADAARALDADCLVLDLVG